MTRAPTVWLALEGRFVIGSSSSSHRNKMMKKRHSSARHELLSLAVLSLGYIPPAAQAWKGPGLIAMLLRDCTAPR